jgi:N-acetyl-gamma-glutamyl-phosphate reductase
MSPLGSPPATPLSVGLVGASGFTGAELLRLLAVHPGFSLEVATGDTQVGRRVADLHPGLGGAYPDLVFAPVDLDQLAAVDVVFACLPHGASQEILSQLVDAGPHLIDLGADFRLNDPGLYDEWYDAAHTRPDLLDRFAYGLPELFGEELAAKRHVAVPGCYPTAAALGLVPLLQAGQIEPTGIIVDAASGLSGAGRAPKENTTFCAADENFSAYGLLNHRHTPEIEQSIGLAAGKAASVLFTPHLAPMSRGILSTSYATPVGSPTTDEALDILAKTYADHPFVVVRDDPPGTKDTLGSNAAHVTARVDPRTGHAVVICAIDNLGKGASGQALQCANLLVGFPETAGLATVGVTP